MGHCSGQLVLVPVAAAGRGAAVPGVGLPPAGVFVGPFPQMAWGSGRTRICLSQRSSFSPPPQSSSPQDFFNKKMVFSFKAVFYLTLMLTTVLKAELAELFTLLTAFTL